MDTRASLEQAIPTAGFMQAQTGFLQIEPVGFAEAPDGAPPAHAPASEQARTSPSFMHCKVFCELADRLAPGSDLHLHGRGEPLLHLHLFDMVRYAAERGIRVSLHTGLSVLTVARAEECIASGLHRLHVAMDGASAATYEAMRGRDHFDRVLRNLRRLMQAHSQLASATQVQLVAHAMRRNLHEIPALVRLAHEEGVGALHVRHLCHPACGMHDSPLHEDGLHHEDPQRVQRYFDQAREIAAAHGVALVLPATRRRRHQPRTHGRRRCDTPWRGSYIGYDGQPMPSCMAAFAPGLPAGLPAGASLPQQGSPASIRLAHPGE